MSDSVTGEEIKQVVRETYGGIARRYVEDSAAAPTRASCCGPSRVAVEDTPQASCCDPSEIAAGEASQVSCCGPSKGSVEGVAQASCCGPSVEVADDAGADAAGRFYSVAELADLPGSVTGVSLGCGNPTAIASLQPGEVVLDLGSGGGIDCFIAAGKVGPEGRVIGLDMTPDMIKLARRNAKKVGLENVEFRYGEMEDIPLPDASVDVVISNCVINLSPDKDAVFGEVFRVLRPGGRMTVSDIVVDGDLPQSVRSRLDAWASCIAGALDESVYLDKIRAVGFEEVEVLSREYAAAEQDCEGEETQAQLDEAGISSRELAGKVASVNVTARKPA